MVSVRVASAALHLHADLLVPLVTQHLRVVQDGDARRGMHAAPGWG